MIRMYAGDLNVGGITGSKDIENKAGDVRIDGRHGRRLRQRGCVGQSRRPLAGPVRRREWQLSVEECQLDRQREVQAARHAARRRSEAAIGRRGSRFQVPKFKVLVPGSWFDASYSRTSTWNIGTWNLEPALFLKLRRGRSVRWNVVRRDSPLEFPAPLFSNERVVVPSRLRGDRRVVRPRHHEHPPRPRRRRIAVHVDDEVRQHVVVVHGVRPRNRLLHEALE